MSLSDVKIRAKPPDKPFKLADSKGFYLYVTPTGSKSWRMKYRYAGKETKLALDLYPEVGFSNGARRCAIRL